MSPTIIRMHVFSDGVTNDKVIQVVTAHHPAYNRRDPAIWTQHYTLHPEGSLTLDWSEEFASEGMAIARFRTVCAEEEGATPEKQEPKHETSIVSLQQKYQSEIESAVPDLAENIPGYLVPGVPSEQALADAIYDYAADYIHYREKDNATLQDIRSAASQISRNIAGGT